MAYGYAVRSFRPVRRPTGYALSNGYRGVAVGSQTRYAQQHPGTVVAVGDQTRAAREAREHSVAPPVAHGPPGVPPPSSPQSLFAKLPPSRYNPERRTLSEESEQGLEQLQRNLLTRGGRSSEDYTTGLAELEQQRGYGTSNHQQALSNLAEAFRRLGVTQRERQNQAGVLPGGGAALQAAAKRLANETKQKGVENTRYEREQSGLNDSAARLLREYTRGQQDIENEGRTAGENDVEYRRRQEGLAGEEAANNGYYEPEPALSAAAKKRAPAKRRPQGKAAFAAARRKARF